MPESPTITPAVLRLAVLGLVVGNILLACGPWMVRLARADGHIGPIAVGFWRLALAWPVLALLLARRPEPRAPGWRLALPLVAIAGLAFAADLGAWHIGILHTRLSNATLFGNVTALLFPLYGFVATRTWPRTRQSLALGLAMVGVTLLLGRSYELSTRYIAGDLLCILAGIFYTTYLIALGRIGGRLGPVSSLLLSVTTGIPLLYLFARLAGEPIWPDAWGALVAMTLGSQLIGQGLLLYALPRVSPLVIGLLLLIQPVVASAIGWIVYGERLGPLDLVGAIGIIAAILLVRDDRKPKPLPAAEPLVGSAT